MAKPKAKAKAKRGRSGKAKAARKTGGKGRSAARRTPARRKTGGGSSASSGRLQELEAENRRLRAEIDSLRSRLEERPAEGGQGGEGEQSGGTSGFEF